MVVVPAFAVGRAQALLLAIHRLKRDGRIPDLPVFLDSPMAIQATAIYRTLTAASTAFRRPKPPAWPRSARMVSHARRIEETR